MPLPAFLPAPIAYNGDWAGLVATAYAIFQNDFLGANNATIDNCNVEVATKKGADGKEECFWHLLTRDDNNNKGNRIPDPNRATRIGWIRPLIANCKDQAVVYFTHLEGSGFHRHYLWLKAEEYVVILEQQKKRAFLVTAYRIDENWTRLNLLKKFKNKTA